MEIGCVAHFSFPYKDEVNFARQNGFKLLQLWYDRNGLSVQCDGDPVTEIKEINFPSIIHAVLDINEIEEHIPKLIQLVTDLHHKEIIIHPVCKSEKTDLNTIRKLSERVKTAQKSFSDIGVKLFIENNSRLDDLLNTSDEIEYLFRENPDVGFLLDLAHLDSYDTLEKIVRVKFPDFLHIADKHFDMVHEHLPIGDGELDFGLIFSDYLKAFSGKAILEITQNKEVLIKSKELLENIFTGI